MKIYIVGNKTPGTHMYTNWIPQSEVITDMVAADLVMFTGGEDVDPSIYDEPIGRRTHSNLKRDVLEQIEFERAFELRKKMIGICRGAQFGCVMSGGRLIQDQKNYDFIHKIKTSDGKVIKITSTHHQAQYPYELPLKNYKVLAWTIEEHRSPYHLDGNNVEINKGYFNEAEIVYYPTTKFLAIQGHPELLLTNASKNSAEIKESLEYLQGLVNNLLQSKI